VITRLLFALSLALGVLAMAMPTAVAAPAAGPGSSLAARYTIDLSVDDAHHAVDAHETVEATNQTGVALSSLVFDVTPRHFSGFTLGQVTANGAIRQPRFDDVVMEVPLLAPLQPDQTAKVTLAFKEIVPTPGDARYGYRDGVLVLGHWFPVLAVYRADGWDRHHYADVGDPFFSETADYQVTVHADPHLVIAHTGVTTTSKNGVSVVTAAGVRDVALAMSRQYQSQSTDVDGTRITSYYLPGDKAGGTAALNDAKQSFAWYVDHLGPYGYPSLDVAETNGQAVNPVGQAYPSLIFVSSEQEHQPTPPGGSLTYLVAQETAHQWLGGIVGNDRVREPWLDEGPTSELAYLFLENSDPSAYFTQWTQVQQDYQQAVTRWGQKTIDTAAAEYTGNDEYLGLLVDGSTIFVDRLRETLGTDAYFAFLRDYVSTYRGENATTLDFLTLAERDAGHDLSGLYRGYFHPASYQEAAATPAATVVPTPTAVPTTTPTPPATATAVAHTPAAGPVEQNTPAAATPAVAATVQATPTAGSSSGFAGTALNLVAVGGVVGVILAAALTLLLLSRGRE